MAWIYKDDASRLSHTCTIPVESASRLHQRLIITTHLNDQSFLIHSKSPKPQLEFSIVFTNLHL
jgi:hypothetical protein